MGNSRGGTGKILQKCSESLEMQPRGRLRVRGRILSVAVKNWVRAKQSIEEEPVRQWYERQIGLLRFEGWARRPDNIGVGLCTGRKLVSWGTSKQIYLKLN
jgi:hypothetical protein